MLIGGVMYKLKTKASFDSAHFLKDYDGKCSNIHGHRWTVEIKVGAETLESDTQNRGMVVDFSNLKKDLKEIADHFDHSLIMETGSLKQATEELHSTFLEMQEVAEKNRGEFPDINRIAEEVLVQSRKGEYEP